jgi:hypothetical protein
MSRPPKLRLNFDSDVQYFLRLKHSLEEDTAYPQEFREQVVSLIVQMQRLLTNAPPRRGEGFVEPVEEITPRKKRARG